MSPPHPMKSRATPLILALLLLGACFTPSADSTNLAALQASRAEPYGAPDLGVSLTVRASLAAVEWSQLSDEQLLAWARIWSEVRSDEDAARPRPEVFDRSPRDGFCVARALERTGDELPEEIRSFFERLAQE